MAQNLQRITEHNFGRGYNDKDKPENLYISGSKGSYMADIKNAFIEENKIIKRKGYASIGDAPASKLILGQQRHEPSGGTKYILRARDNAGGTNSVVESWSGSGNWATLTGATSQTAGADHEFVMAENATYIFNGNDTVLKTTDGTSTSTVAAIPVGTQARWWHNFLFVLGVTGNKSRLYFSDVNTPETFDAVNGYIDVNKDDQEDLVQMASIRDTFILFKPTKIFTLTGYGTADFTLDDMGDFAVGVGTSAPRSVIETENDVYYLSYFGDRPHFRSVNRTREGNLYGGAIISDQITGTMNRMITTRVSQCAGVYDGRRLWWSVVTSGTTNNEVLVYDTITQGWTRHTGINASVFHLSTISGEPSVYFGSSTTNGKSYHLNNTSTNDDGDAIDFCVDTPMYAPNPGAKSRFKYLYMTADISADIDIDVDFSKDGFSFGDLNTISLTGEGAQFGTAIFGISKFGASSVARDRLDFAGGQAYYMQYRFCNSNADEEVSIREWELFYQTKKLRSI